MGDTMLSHTTTATITTLAAIAVAWAGPLALIVAVPAVMLTCMRGDTTQERAVRAARRI